MFDQIIFPIPIIHIGPVAMQLPGLVLLFGFWAAIWVAARAARVLSQSGDTVQEDDIYTLGFYTAVAGAIGARLWYVITHWPAFAADPLAIVGINLSTLDGTAGVVIGLLAGAAYAWRKKLPVRRLLDALAPGAALMIAAISLANLFSGDAYGTPSTLPWSIELWDAERHPVQLYEVLAALATVAVLWVIIRRIPASGLPAMWFVALYSGQRVALEAFRAESPLLPGGWRAVQVLGLIVLGASLWTLSRTYEVRTPAPASSAPVAVAGQSNGQV